MKRKIFSKLLMGALLVASVSSFTSCKDYDDDINSLKESVAKAALQSNLDALSSQVATVKSTADQALTTANAAATKSELTSAQKAALDKAAEGIAAATTAQETADAAKALAEEAKKTAENIDLSAYAKTSEVEAMRDAAIKTIQTALADYWTADVIQGKLDAIKQEINDATDAKIKELQEEVDKFKAAYGEIWSAVTNISLYANLSDGTGAANFDPNNSAWANLNGDNFDIAMTYGRVNKDHLRHTTVKLNGTWALPPTAAAKATTQKDGSFGKNDYYGEDAHFSAKVNGSSVTFNHGDYVRPVSSIIVRVSPINATLTASDIKFINSQGGDLNKVIEVRNVAPFTGLLTRAGSPAGLWRIDFSLADKVMPGNMTDETMAWGFDKLFAVAANNTSSQSDRYAVSEFELTFDTDAYDGLYSLDGAIITKNLNDPFGAGQGDHLYNVAGRVDYDGTRTFNKGYNDYEWTVFDATTATNNNANPTNVAPAVRKGNDTYNVDNGQEFYVIATDDVAGIGKAQGTGRTAKYAYVIRDDNNANLGNDASEINAWNTYNIEGVNTLCDGGVVKLKVTIPSTQTMGDEVAFRLFAVNEDGTLCDPDGYPFTVYVGKELKTAKVTASFTATKALGLKKVFTLSGDALSNTAADFATVTTLGVLDISTYPIKLTTADNVLRNTVKSLTFLQNSGAVATSWANATKVLVEFSTTAGEEMAVWPDDATATASIILPDAVTNTDNFKIEFALTKNLPTKADVAALWSWKANQLQGNVWRAVMYPESAEDAANAYTVGNWQNAFAQGTSAYRAAYKGMNNAINDLADNTAIWDETYPVANATTRNLWQEAQVDGDFVFYFKKSYGDSYSKDLVVTRKKYDQSADLYLNTPLPYVSAYVLQLDQNKTDKTPIKNLIDNLTQHDSEIWYDFGQVSSKVIVGDIVPPYDLYAPAGQNYIVKIDEFKTIYTCPFDGVTATIKPYTSGKKINAAGTGIINAGDQEWNFVDYEHQATEQLAYDHKHSTGMLFGNTTTLTNNVMTGFAGANFNNYVTLSSPYGAQFVTVSIGEYIQHLVGGAAGATAATNTPTAKLISDATGNEDYFSVEITPAGAITLTPKSTITDPGYDTPSKIVITGKCAFGHDHKLEIPFNVKTTASH